MVTVAAAPLPSKRRPGDGSASPAPGQRPRQPKRTKRERNMGEGSTDEVLRYDIQSLLSSSSSLPDSSLANDLPEPFSEIQVDIVDVSSTGDGLGLRSPDERHVYVVPFTVPGDKANIRVIRHFPHDHHSVADLVAVATPSPLRDDSRIRCRYFARCGGCQFQMLDYAQQLRLKRRVLVKAYRNFANLPTDLVPDVAETIPSPLQYGYRTKLTPHFDGPPSSASRRQPKRRDQPGPSFEACPDIGFMLKGRRSVLDIEDCPIATDVVRRGMTRERERMRRDFSQYRRGATILLRESTRRCPNDGPDTAPTNDPDTDTYAVHVQGDGFVDVKTCETDSKATSTEYVGDHIFTNPAGSFFQNNNAILPVFTSYIRDRILPLPPPVSSSDLQQYYLIDAYSGSGLFTITLASLFAHSTGIDVAADSIASARRNAALNGLAPDRCRFIAADAAHLFREVDYPPDRTVVVLDPPRKGCDADFLAQLARFAPRRVLYVSCNVHTQARDVGSLVRGHPGGAAYRLKSLVGFDFFPQTGHVEGVAILDRHDGDDKDHLDGDGSKKDGVDSNGDDQQKPT
ncbi:tRNA (uracil-5-)-methyltransferase [Ophiocordyceps camponoti-floridani]|uniref:tRNA (Uracil-5-)-methyltransferase n=1 Tax=Ophiocordyceps camponoti-floridani TaxID=2030778 RepID=A0A8H4Q1W2_9HYPO|nr:tRNA (uracil-5-)-methyltransferase [Ophiocordyceps camponoti-floridani]